MKYLKKINEIKILSRDHNLNNKDWYFNYGEKVSDYKQFEVFYDRNSGKYTFKLNNNPVIIALTQDMLGYKQIEGIEVDSRFRGNKYALIAYEYFIEKYGALMSDFLQTVNSKKIWKSLMEKYKLYHWYMPLKNNEKTLIKTMEDFEKCYQEQHSVIVALK